MLSNPERETVKSPFFYWSSEGPCQAAVTDSKKTRRSGVFWLVRGQVRSHRAGFACRQAPTQPHHATGQCGYALLQLFLVVVRRGVSDLTTDLAHASNVSIRPQKTHKILAWKISDS